MTDHKEVIEKVVQKEKVSVLIYPVSVPTFLYGLWLMLFPTILENYTVYNLVSTVLQSWQVGIIFMLIGLGIIFSFIFYNKKALLLCGIFGLMAWSVFTVAFISTPPPNTVWLFAGTMSYLTFSLARRV